MKRKKGYCLKNKFSTGNLFFCLSFLFEMEFWHIKQREKKGMR